MKLKWASRFCLNYRKFDLPEALINMTQGKITAYIVIKYPLESPFEKYLVWLTASLLHATWKPFFMGTIAWRLTALRGLSQTWCKLNELWSCPISARAASSLWKPSLVIKNLQIFAVWWKACAAVAVGHCSVSSSLLLLYCAGSSSSPYSSRAYFLHMHKLAAESLVSSSMLHGHSAKKKKKNTQLASSCLCRQSCTVSLLQSWMPKAFFKQFRHYSWYHGIAHIEHC